VEGFLFAGRSWRVLLSKKGCQPTHQREYQNHARHQQNINYRISARDYFFDSEKIPVNIESFRKHCLAKRGVTEEFPFGELTLVFKVVGKMFALTNVDTQSQALNFVRCIRLFCQPTI
jgi:hypothetical protein